jgi:calmodulin
MADTQRPAAISPEFLSELKEDFRQADSDRDGHIDFGEFQSLLENLEAGMSDDELRLGFHEIDVDRDGRIDFREFSAWWTEG